MTGPILSPAIRAASAALFLWLSFVAKLFILISNKLIIINSF